MGHRQELRAERQEVKRLKIVILSISEGSLFCCRSIFFFGGKVSLLS